MKRKDLTVEFNRSAVADIAGPAYRFFSVCQPTTASGAESVEAK